MDEKISKLFLPILDKLYNTEPAGEPFRKPVDPIKYGCYDYYLYVKHPIDLSTIRNKLVTYQYKDAWRFIADIQHMFSNAYLFNKKGTPVYEFTNKLSKIWNSELNSIMQRLNYCCGIQHKFGPQLLFCHGTTPDRYCQIAVGAKYKCFQDQYSFCIPCFNKIDTDTISIQALTCETSRMKLPEEPVRKSDFVDCTNDHWQYETFIQCTECTRRVHQICDLYPEDEDRIEQCLQHEQIEQEQKSQCKVLPEFEPFAKPSEIAAHIQAVLNPTAIENRAKSNRADTTTTSETFKKHTTTTSTATLNTNHREADEKPKLDQLTLVDRKDSDNKSRQSQDTRETSSDSKTGTDSATSQATNDDIDHELLQFARDLDDSNSALSSPNPEEIKSRHDSAKDSCHREHSSQCSRDERPTSATSKSSTTYTTCSGATKTSVDIIAARLSINKLSSDSQTSDTQKTADIPLRRENFVCNHCYRKKRLGLNLRHRKFSARRLPHTRMSRYIETKVNEHIRENAPSAGEVTIRILAAYREKIDVKPEMREYLKRCRANNTTQHSHLDDYPEEYEYTNRAIFAWQEIDGVDVCVFGMHVQEYGEDCPEPNRQVVYLSYLDSVHFFRPKQFRTAVYHEILLSYFKYVKKLGFRRVFIWVCPSRKGDDYIFYRHPTEQKMPTLKRLSDWYIHLLDKGVLSGIVERHQNVYEYVMSENWTSILSLPYLSGDYWPGEFERLLKIMIESQKKYEEKIIHKLQQTEDNDESNDGDSMQDFAECNAFKHKNSLLGSVGLKPALREVSSMRGTSGDDPEDDNLGSISMRTNESKFFEPFNSSRSEDQPLDLSKGSSTTSPESQYDDEFATDISFDESYAKKKRKKSSAVMGYTKKRGRTSYQASQSSRSRSSQIPACDNSSRYYGPSSMPCRQKSSTQTHRDSQSSDSLLTPEEELSRNFERSLKRQKEGFIVVRLSECDCSPHFESQRRREEITFSCDLMKGREPFLQLARTKNYEFSTLRRAKFSSLAMVKHLGLSFKLDPICNGCYSFDSSKRHYACSYCEDFYLCTSCHENTHHDHIMSLMAPASLPDIDEFLKQCSLASSANSISSASSTISNKSFNETTLELPASPEQKKDTSLNDNIPFHRHLSNKFQESSTSMPLTCKRQRNRETSLSDSRTEDEENANINPFMVSGGPKSGLSSQPSPPPSHSLNSSRTVHVEFDQVLIENFMRHAELTYNVDFDEMKSESKKLLTHYWSCPIKDTCSRCKFVVLSCSFMSVLMRSTRMQMLINCGPNEMALPGNGTSNNHPSGINLTTTPRFGYQPKE